MTSYNQLGCIATSAIACTWLVSGRRQAAKKGHNVRPFGGVGNAEAGLALKFSITCTSKVESSIAIF